MQCRKKTYACRVYSIGAGDETSPEDSMRQTTTQEEEEDVEEIPVIPGEEGIVLDIIGA